MPTESTTSVQVTIYMVGAFCPVYKLRCSYCEFVVIWARVRLRVRVEARVRIRDRVSCQNIACAAQFITIKRLSKYAQ